MEQNSDKEIEPLPDFTEGQILEVEKVLKDGMTKPPARLTEDKMLKVELVKYGLGTSATRAATLAGLVKDGFIALDSKTGQLTPLEKARKTIQAMSDLGSQFYLPEKTADWEAYLKMIAMGQLEPDEFLDEIKEEIRQTVKGYNK